MAEIKDFEIKLVTTADLNAAKAAAEALGDVAEAGQNSADTQVQETVHVVDAEKKAFASKKDLRDAVRGLGMEFPLLGSIARLAINPIALAAAGATAAFASLKRMIRAAVRLGGGYG